MYFNFHVYIYVRYIGFFDVGDYMYPVEPDYEGTRDLPPLLSSSVDELTDTSRSLNRMVFSSRAVVRSLSQIDTTVQDTTDVDKLLQKATVICNI